jgi:uncharacterized protein YlxP (DUF503 family)
MICTVGKILIYIPQAESLKEKRRVLKSVITRTVDKFSISCIEADFNDLWQKSLIGIAFVSKDSVQADRVESAVRAFYEDNYEFEIIEMDFEKINI